MRVVVDTNVFVSSFFNMNGNPRKIIDYWKKREVILCVCEEILEEYLTALGRFGLDEEPEMKELLELFKKRPNLHWIRISGEMKWVAKDPDDNKFLECAVRGKAEAIVSGDRHLLELKYYEGIPIVSPADFLDYMRLRQSTKGTTED